jgi:hypothetical protein
MARYVRWLIASALGLVLTLGLGPAPIGAEQVGAAQPLTSAAASDQSVTGSGTGNFPVTSIHFTVSAQSGPAGENARGVIQYRSADFEGTADVGCLLVVGNRAGVAGRVRKERVQSPSSSQFNIIALFVEDNGNPAPGQAADRAVPILVAQPDGPVEPWCASALTDFPESVGPLQQGNVTVRSK